MKGLILMVVVLAALAAAFYISSPTPNYQNTTGAQHVDNRLEKAGVP